MTTLPSVSSLDDSPPHLVSKDEAMYYYSGISPSPPKLVYRTGLLTTPWVKPKGLEAYRQLKQVRGVYGHRINDVWEDLGPQVRDLLNVQRIRWSSIDVARFVTDGESDTQIVGPVVIWIGVLPDSLEGAQAVSSSEGILVLLKSFGIEDVEVEYRESIYRRSVGPELLRHVSSVNDTVDVRSPLTPTLCLSIAAADRPEAQGTMGLYFAEGGASDKVLGLTCHHVLFKTDATTNNSYALASNTSAPRKYVQLLGTRAFDKLLDSIRLRIGRHAIMLEQHEDTIKRLEARLADGDEDDEEEVADARKELGLAKGQVTAVNDAIETLEKFYSQVKQDWGVPRARVIGHIRFSPALAFNVGPDGFTEDWGAFEIDGPKFAKGFKGNVMDLGTEIPSDVFTLKMYPRDDGLTTFKYPSDRLLPLRDMISQELMRRPDMLDHDNEPCVIVIKSGNATGVTIGRATGIFSFVRDDDTGKVSKEWAVYNYDKNSGVFSAPGDSGSIVVDGRGRIGGLLTGGAGKTETSDVTYVTPMFWLWPRIKQRFPNAHLNPTITVA
ncbi:hypothetical protein AcW1_005200 [Taiwanofungus camphoratus]|nr:hypothetical protein AcW2_003970 [Antrodia cinnamomea]KAI0933365.1 hypothetical protein AcV5_005527 [Antrodia cinnamomea]KAI0948856.1 hypothetical protein AcV7_009487 [Antrodia cinnamomea]KAI0956547.1 hypothetical protein AcW1_005200 [Antrodia cinnamomea]